MRWLASDFLTNSTYIAANQQTLDCQSSALTTVLGSSSTVDCRSKLTCNLY